MPTNEEIKSKQRADWDFVAEAWDRWDDFFGQSSRPVNEWICQAAKLTPGNRVLDLACGSGQPALTAAVSVSPGGRVTALDLAPGMVEVVARKAKLARLDNVEPVVGDMEDLHFEAGTFDAVTCRFGFMFCPNIPKALAEAKRVLKPGGRLSFVVWDTPQENKWLSGVLEAINQVAPGPAADPKAPGIFRLCDQGELGDLLRGAGFERFDIESRRFPFVYKNGEHQWDAVTEMAAPVRQRLLSLSETDQAKAKALVVDAALQAGNAAGVSYDATTLCIWAE